ncbi:hypothetical protein KP509_18G064000 [Ceratopteris richardii]|uniref:Uncharacterized protein n=1 Tax=Ceratopteris richardii TaxID=49495 RepID=A0A8T2SU24_CERRI|nr:hypothetical protein KP509_18G064000 [Ceratopteris richardii]
MAHKLSLLQSPPYESGSFKCDLCFEAGCGPLYHCSDCNFDLHISCAAIQPVTTHFTHPNHLLHLIPPIPNRRHTCNSCGCVIRGFAFRCDECDFDLHSVCARTPRFIRHSSHPHPLELHRQERAKNVRCDGCKRAVADHAYRCRQCSFVLHQSCARMPKKTMHVSHENHPLRALTPTTATMPRAADVRSCHQCQKRVRGWEFACIDCDIHLHPRCAHLEHHLPHDTCISQDISGRNENGSSASPTSVSPMTSFATYREAQNLKVPKKDDVEAMKRVLQFLEEMGIGTAPDAEEGSQWSYVDDQNRHVHCPTCLEGFDSRNPPKLTSCGHAFHLPCILEWTERSNNCPICRSQFEVLL